jgi:hypothetical protein
MPDGSRTRDLRLERTDAVRAGSGIPAAMRPKCDQKRAEMRLALLLLTRSLLVALFALQALHL